MNRIDPNTSLDQFLLTAPELEPFFDRLGREVRRDGVEATESLFEFCERQRLDWPTMRRVLTALQAPRRRQVPALDLMTLGELCDHLEETQRSRLHAELERVEQLLRDAVAWPGTTQPQLQRFQQTFTKFRRRLVAHLRKEAGELFPLLRRCSTGINGERPTRSLLKTRLTRMEREHEQTDAMLAELREIAHAKGLGSSGSPAAGRIPEVLAGLDQALQEQLYFENLVLFPRALGMAMAR